MAAGFCEGVGVGKVDLIAARELGEMIDGGTGVVGGVVVPMDVKGLD